MFASLLCETAIASLTPVYFFKSIVFKFLGRQWVSNGLSTEA